MLRSVTARNPAVSTLRSMWPTARSRTRLDASVGATDALGNSRLGTSDDGRVERWRGGLGFGLLPFQGFRVCGAIAGQPRARHHRLRTADEIGRASHRGVCSGTAAKAAIALWKATLVSVSILSTNQLCEFVNARRWIPMRLTSLPGILIHLSGACHRLRISRCVHRVVNVLVVLRHVLLQLLLHRCRGLAFRGFRRNAGAATIQCTGSRWPSGCRCLAPSLSLRPRRDGRRCRKRTTRNRRRDCHLLPGWPSLPPPPYTALQFVTKVIGTPCSFATSTVTLGLRQASLKPRMYSRLRHFSFSDDQNGRFGT